MIYTNNINILIQMETLQIYQANPQWRYVLFKLQMILGDPSVQLLKIIQHKGHLGKQYEQAIKIDTAIDITNHSQSEINSFKTGNPSSCLFQAGCINITDKNKKITRKMLLFKLGINNMLPIHSTGARQLTKIKEFPDGVDALYVSENKDQMNINPHTFRVKSRTQCLLEYQVEYRVKGVENMKKWDRDKILCEMCNLKKGVYFCKQEQQILCIECFDGAHRTLKKKTHKKQELSAFNCTPVCVLHPNNRYTLYCLICQEVKCEDCVKNQTHRQKKHEVFPLSQLYSAYKQKQQDFLEEIKKKLKGFLNKIQQKITRLEREYETEQKDLENKFAAKLQHLRQNYNLKFSKCVAIHCQVKRKYDQFLWVHSFMKYTQDFLILQDNIQMKESFAKYLQQACKRQYFENIDRNIT